MVYSYLYILAAMAIILFLIEQNLHKIRGYIIFDRIDIQVEITPVPFKDISETAPGESSAAIRERVIRPHHSRLRQLRASSVTTHCRSHRV